jgi:hypothetical protein
VAARLTEAVDLPVTSQVVSASEAVRTRPSPGAPEVARLDGGTEVPVLGRFDGYLYVRSPSGPSGWVSDALAQQQQEQQ